MESKLELLEQLISELEAENTKLKDQNTKLRQIIEANARRDARVKELGQKNTELEARLALLEQGITEVTGQLQNDKQNDIPEVLLMYPSVVDQLNIEVGRAPSNNASTESL
jgi:hypothetical protein